MLIEDAFLELQKIKEKLIISKAKQLYPQGDCDLYCPQCSAGLVEGDPFTVSILDSQHLCGLHLLCPNKDCWGERVFHIMPEESDLLEGQYYSSR